MSDPALAGGLPEGAVSRRRIRWEIAIVLALSLGASAVYAIVALAYRATRETPISQQTTTLNPSRSDTEIFDLIYQVLGVVFDLVPVLLVCYLLWSSSRPHLGRLGVDFSRAGRDTGLGVLLVAAIGIPGLALYLVSRQLGFAVAVNPAGLDEYWWTVPVLLLSAARAALIEEIIVLGYLFTRLKELGVGKWGVIVGAAVLRGSYHLYQGPWAFVANLLMGLLFGWLYSRTGRVIPFLVAHFLIDAIVFVGYPFAAALFPELFGLPSV